MKFSDKTKSLAYLKAKGRCALCDKFINIRSFELDHIVPRVLGGSNSLSNAQVACHRCNSAKQDSTFCKTLYHYTVLDRLDSILKTGIEMSPREGTKLYHNERRVVWLTTSEEWEPTCFFGQDLSNHIKVRLTIKNVFPKHHMAYRTLPTKLYKQLLRVAIAAGSDVKKWYVYNHNITLHQIDTVEIYIDGMWSKL